MKKILLLPIILNFAFTSELTMLQLSGVKAQVENEEVLIQREIHSDCIKFAMEPELFWGEDFAKKEVSNNCKKTFITSKGMVQPINYNNKVKTVGELEVLEFIKTKYNKSVNNYALVDTRPKSWYETGTIPTAINIPFDELEEDELFMDLYLENLKKLGIKKQKDTYNFDNAKTIIVFCNGAWCKQSHAALDRLIEMGYPQEKLFWYRGGIHSWNSMSFTIIKPKE